MYTMKKKCISVERVKGNVKKELWQRGDLNPQSLAYFELLLPEKNLSKKIGTEEDRTHHRSVTSMAL